MFSIKIFDLTMVTFNPWTTSDLGRPLFSPVSDSTSSILKQNGLRILAQNRAAFCLIRVLPQKQSGTLTRLHSKTARYGLRNDRTFSININNDYTSILTLQVLLLPCVANSSFNKIKFFSAIVILYIRINKEKHGKKTQVKNCGLVNSFAKGDCLLQ